MNKVILMGRLTRDPLIRQAGDKAIAEYTLAVDRHVARNNGQQTADFIRCVAWEKKALFAEKYCRQGTKLVVTGRIQTGSYKDKDGKTVFTTDVVVEEQEFAESKGTQTESKGTQTESNDGFMSVPDMEGLPFN